MRVNKLQACVGCWCRLSSENFWVPHFFLTPCNMQRQPRNIPSSCDLPSSLGRLQDGGDEVTDQLRAAPLSHSVARAPPEKIMVPSHPLQPVPSLVSPVSSPFLPSFLNQFSPKITVEAPTDASFIAQINTKDPPAAVAATATAAARLNGQGASATIFNPPYPR